MLVEPYGAAAPSINGIRRFLKEPYPILRIIGKYMENIDEIKTIFINDGILVKIYIYLDGRWLYFR